MYGSWTVGRCRSNPSGITEIIKKYQKSSNQMITGFFIILSFTKALIFRKIVVRLCEFTILNYLL